MKTSKAAKFSYSLWFPFLLENLSIHQSFNPQKCLYILFHAKSITIFTFYVNIPSALTSSNYLLIILNVALYLIKNNCHSR